MKDIYNPDYYKTGKIEVADYIEDKGFNFFLGNVVKYVSRAGKKDGNSTIQDLKKASWYLNKEIARQEQLRAEEVNKRYSPFGISEGEHFEETTSESEEIETEYPYTEDDFEFKEGKDYDDDEEEDEPLG